MRAWLSQQGLEAEQIVCPPADRFVGNLAAGVCVIDVNLRCCAKDHSGTWASRAMTPSTKSASRSGAPRGSTAGCTTGRASKFASRRRFHFRAGMLLDCVAVPKR